MPSHLPHHFFFMAATLGVSLAAESLARQAPTSAQATVEATKLPFKDPDNAALLYFKTWLQKDYIDLKKPCGDQLQSGVPLWRPDAALAKQLRDGQPAIQQIIRATRRPQADWGLEYSQGIGLLLSHPAELRASARILACDARRCLGEGDMEGACERVAAIERLVRHCTTDRVLISGLVAIAIDSLVTNEIRAILNTGRISATGREAILTELRKVAEPDGFGMKRGVEGERWWTTGWIRTFATGPDAGKKLAEQLTPLLDAPGHQETLDAIPTMSEAQINAALNQVDEFYGQMIAFWGTPSADEQFKAMAQRLEDGAYGDLAKMLVPSLSKAHSADVKAQAEHAATLKQLEAFVPYR